MEKIGFYPWVRIPYFSPQLADRGVRSQREGGQKVLIHDSSPVASITTVTKEERGFS